MGGGKGGWGGGKDMGGWEGGWGEEWGDEYSIGIGGVHTNFVGRLDIYFIIILCKIVVKEIQVIHEYKIYEEYTAVQMILMIKWMIKINNKFLVWLIEFINVIMKWGCMISWSMKTPTPQTNC